MGMRNRLMYYYVERMDLYVFLMGQNRESVRYVIMDLVKAAGVEIKVGVVQTAYANGTLPLI